MKKPVILISIFLAAATLIWGGLFYWETRRGARLTLVFASFFGTEKFWAHMFLVVLLAILRATTMFFIPKIDTHSWAASPPSPRFSRRCSRR